MAEFPALYFYTDAYLADTAHLTLEECGAYTNLLFVAWRIPDGRLRDDDRYLARCARATPRQWERVKAAVMAFWDKDDDLMWSQKRLESERIKSRLRVAAASANAKSRWLKTNGSGHAPAQRPHMRRQSGGNASISISNNNINGGQESMTLPTEPWSARIAEFAAEVGEGKKAAETFWGKRQRNYWGPTPGEKGCQAPPELLKEFGL